jgi:U4/U6.U5 tri-snRNP-associated protein 1
LEIKRRLGAAAKNMESLERSKFTVASEFYTEEEMATFKKPKKPKDSKKIRKRGSTALKPDDLLVGTAIVAADEDFGSRYCDYYTKLYS